MKNPWLKRRTQGTIHYLSLLPSTKTIDLPVKFKVEAIIGNKLHCVMADDGTMIWDLRDEIDLNGQKRGKLAQDPVFNFSTRMFIFQVASLI